MTACFHCALEVPPGCDCRVVILGQSQPMCCPGCQAVAQTIVDAGLEDYYQLRDAKAVTQQGVLPKSQEFLELFNDEELQQDYLVTDTSVSKDTKQTVLLVEGITCAACVWLIERDLRRLAGIASAQVNLSTSRLQVSWDPTQIQLSEILTKLQRLGYRASPYQARAQEAAQRQAIKSTLQRLAVAGLGMLQVMMYAAVLYVGYFQHIESTFVGLFRLGSLVVATPIVFYSGWPFLHGAWRALRLKGLTMDVPISLAILVAYSASVLATVKGHGEVYFDSVTMLIFFLTLGRYLEMVARGRTFKALQFSGQQGPRFALALRDGEVIQIPVKKLVPGDRIRIKPGEQIPVDGRIVAGEGACNEALLTGEQYPVAKRVGDLVMGGAQNIDNSLTIEVSKKCADSMMSTIASLLDRAQADRPPLVSMTQKLAGYFVLAVLLFASLTAIGWSVIAPEKALWVTLSVLVITCPCALSLATPVALTVATNALARLGFLITRSRVCEGLTTITHVVFDKTGTLTQGAFSLERVVTTCEKADVLAMASALEAHSVHPIAHAFKQESSAQDLEASSVSMELRGGISGEINGERYYLGNSEFVRAHCLDAVLAPNQGDGLWLALATKTRCLAWFCLRDSLRPGASAVVSALKAQGLRVSLLTGDNSSLVQEVATRVGIEVVVQGATPTQKMQVIKGYQAQGDKVAMIGDGINDAPVLSAADVSIAMGGSADLALISADAILFDSELSLLPTVLTYCRRVKRTIKQNFIWALVYNGLALPLAMSGVVTPYFAALGMSMSSLLVVMNALRLKKTSGVSDGDIILSHTN